MAPPPLSRAILHTIWPFLKRPLEAYLLAIFRHYFPSFPWPPPPSSEPEGEADPEGDAARSRPAPVGETEQNPMASEDEARPEGSPEGETKRSRPLPEGDTEQTPVALDDAARAEGSPEARVAGPDGGPEHKGSPSEPSGSGSERGAKPESATEASPEAPVGGAKPDIALDTREAAPQGGESLKEPDLVEVEARPEDVVGPEDRAFYMTLIILVLFILLLLLGYLARRAGGEPGPQASAGLEGVHDEGPGAGAPQRTPEWKKKRGVSVAASPRRRTRGCARLRVNGAARCARLAAAAAGFEGVADAGPDAGAPPRTPEWDRRRGVAEAASPRRRTRGSARLRVDGAAECARLSAGNLGGANQGVEELPAPSDLPRPDV